jgi:hypothetical protein
VNPIEHFEKSARKIWAADLKPEDKARRMLKLSEAICHYVQRLEEKSALLVAPGDQWAKYTFQRAKAHLSAIAEDARDLSHQLQSRSVKCAE